MLCWYFFPTTLALTVFSTMFAHYPVIEQVGSPTEGAGSSVHACPCMPDPQSLLLPLPSGLQLESHGEGGLHLHPSLRVLEPVCCPGSRWTFSSQNPITLQLFLVLSHLLGPGDTAASVTPEPENSYF